MATRSLPAIAGDFNGVLAFFKSRGILSSQPGERLVQSARNLHRATYSLILWRFRLRRLPEHGQVFIEEIASDALQILPQALMGYGKTTKLLARGVIENTIRHIYFSDHPIEFGRMNRDRKYYLSIDDLFQYILAHPEFIGTEGQFDAVNRFRSLYDELSAGVHGRKVQDLEMRVSLNRIVFNQASFEAHVHLVQKCAESANFLLAAFHKEQFYGFQKEDRQVVLGTIGQQGRRVLRALA